MTGPSLFRTPLSQARGHGAARHGLDHFIVERVTAIALVPLALWAAVAASEMSGASFDAVRAWLALPLNAVLTCLLILAAFVHLRLVVQVVIEDYITRFESKAALLVLNLFVCIAGVALGIFSVLRVALGGA